MISLTGCKDEHRDDPLPLLQLSVARVGTYTLDLNDFSKNNAAPVDNSIVASFSSALDISTVPASFQLKEKNTGEEVNLAFSYLDENKTVAAAPDQDLVPNTVFQLIITSSLDGAGGESFPGHTIEFTTVPGTLTVISFMIESEEVTDQALITDVSLEGLNLSVTFSGPLDPAWATTDYFKVTGGGTVISQDLTLADENQQVVISVNEKLRSYTKYQVWISNEVRGAGEEVLQQFSRFFYTGTDGLPVFTVIADDDLLTLVQQHTFKYFWDFAQPASGMARERNTSGDLVTSGGSGFGIMAIITGIERGFITRQEGLERMGKILDFLEGADRFHGAWSHWINGNTGAVIPFSANDNGGDLVETSFLVQGLLTFRQYLDTGIPAETVLIDRINDLWESVEWDWYTRGGENVLYWHWSPDKEWIMNHQIRGYNECLITYVLAASSPTYSIDPPVYTEGWARNGAIQNGNNYFGIPLPLGEQLGGPLFFAHYSYLGLDPRDLSDTYASYWTQNVNHTLINRAYCISNPVNYVAYGESCWGLTASDNQTGYSAHSPTNDRGVITPTAALSSMPYTPDESMEALHFFYYSVGDRLWGEYGFYDAFNITDGWVADSYLAIDQGPIIIMIENYRTGLLWDLFMSCPEVQDGLTKLGFSY